LWINSSLFFSDDDEEDIEQEVLNQSIGRISLQMAKLSSIIVDTVGDDGSGIFSSYRIDMAELARHSDDSVPDDSENVTNVYEHTATGPEITAADPENSVTYPDAGPSGTDVNPADPEVGTASASSADSPAIHDDDIPPSPDGSVTFIEDAPVENEVSTSTRRIKSKSSKIKRFFKGKTKKHHRYVESTV
jgi:hypothetical protein